MLGHALARRWGWQDSLCHDCRALQPGPLFEHVQLLQPPHERVCCRMGAFLVLRAFYVVQDFVPLVDARPNLLFASKACRVVEITNDAPILEMQLGRKIELDQHITVLRPSDLDEPRTARSRPAPGERNALIVVPGRCGRSSAGSLGDALPAFPSLDRRHDERGVFSIATSSVAISQCAWARPSGQPSSNQM